MTPSNLSHLIQQTYRPYTEIRQALCCRGKMKAIESLRSKVDLLLPHSQKPQKPTGYTFTDEMWRTRTEHNPRLLLRIGRPCLAEEQPQQGIPSVPPRTAAQRARAEDEHLWKTSSSRGKYEERKRALYESRRVARQEWLERQPVFHPFLSLPTELRLYIWQLAMQEPTDVQLTVARYSPAWRGGGCCGIRMPARAREIRAIAMFPPLMLASRESNALASAHYKKAFRSFDGTGGVLAAYPTTLHADPERDTRDAIHLLACDDRERGMRDATHLPACDDLALVHTLALHLEGLRIETVIRHVRQVLKASNIMRVAIDSKDTWDPQPPKLFRSLRRLLEAGLPVTDYESIEFEIGFYHMEVAACYLTVFVRLCGGH
ncbi:hypothetical protein F5Y17DRAFT_133592 [Xylariaceae sp. FL0594]|nr:hypothetical protein F5Y17DRAFT_133592 [Xylariaceae sp. FL0594]